MTEIPGGPEFSGSPEESNFVKAAVTEVNKLILANRVNRRWRVAQTIVSVILAVAVGVLAFVAVQVNSENNQLRSDSIASCQNGNDFRTGQNEIWEKLFELSYGYSPPNKNTPLYKLQQEFLAYVNKVDELHDCTTLYGAASSP